MCAPAAAKNGVSPERDAGGNGFVDIVTLMLSADDVRKKAKEHGVTVTEFLCAAMMEAILEIQAEKVHSRRRRKPVKVLIPVNLRKLFQAKRSGTLPCT